MENGKHNYIWTLDFIKFGRSRFRDKFVQLSQCGSVMELIPSVLPQNSVTGTLRRWGFTLKWIIRFLANCVTYRAMIFMECLIHCIGVIDLKVVTNVSLSWSLSSLLPALWLSFSTRLAYCFPVRSLVLSKRLQQHIDPWPLRANPAALFVLYYVILVCRLLSKRNWCQTPKEMLTNGSIIVYQSQIST